jgi:hypothetical protein
MKSIILSSLAVGLTMSQVFYPNYYIGPYTVNGVVASLIAYPTGQCVSTGAESSMGNAIFLCAGGNMIIKETYSSTDVMCEGTYKNSSATTSLMPGMNGYFYCGGEEDYMVIDQYLGGCSSWADGTDSALVATTTIANGACVYAGKSPAGGTHVLFAIQVCDGDEQVTVVYQDDPTCTNQSSIVEGMETPLGCSYYTTENKQKIFSAMRECVAYGEELRCTSPLVSFSTTIKFVDLEHNYNWMEVFEDLFPYSTVTLWNTTMMVDDYIVETIWLNMSFCTPHEDAWYSSSLQNLGKTLWNVAPADAVCWTCDWWSCSNATLCGNDNYCVGKTQCVNATTTGQPTTATNSAVGSYISLLTLIVLAVISLSF